MKDIRFKNIERLFIKNHGYATSSELIKAGADSRFILELINLNKAIKIKHGLYQWSSYLPESNEEMIILSKALPNGVFCLFTALSFHELTTYNPREFNMAIFRDTKRPSLPDHPPVKVFYFSEKQYNTGISMINIEGHLVKIFDLEKTVCDFVRYRNKVGPDIMYEAIKTYMARKDRNLDKIWRYAEILNIRTVIKPYLEALT